MKTYEIKQGMCLGLSSPCPSDPYRSKLVIVDSIRRDATHTVLTFKDTSSTVHLLNDVDVLLPL